MTVRAVVLVGALAMAAGVAGVALAGGPGPPPAEVATYVMEPPLPAPEVDPALRGPHGDVRLSDLRGHPIVLFFGYTHCPDVCPMTLARVARARGMMDAESADRVQVVLVTVDPERDSPEATDAYARRFDPAFRGLSGERDAVDAVASAYGVFSGRSADGAGVAGTAPSSDDYTVDHSASLLVLDPDGRVRMVLGQDVAAEALARALEWVVAAG